MQNESLTMDERSTSILIVEDSVHYSQILTRLLVKGLGYTDVTAVPETAAAYRKVSAEPSKYNLLFVDFHFPVGENGAAFLEKLQREKLMEGRIGFIITSDPSLDLTNEAAAAGAIGVVAKPFNLDQLRQQLDRARRMLFADSVEYF